MQLTSKFDLGQRVWWIYKANLEVWVPCGFCGETGYNTGLNGEKKPCPECYGRKRSLKYEPAEWQVQGNGHIGQIKAIAHDYNIEYAKDDKPEDHAEYMLRETGIVCGTYYYEKELFASEGEAQIACDKRNKEEEHNEKKT